MTDPEFELASRERELRRHLSALEKKHQALCKPIIDELVKLHSMKTPRQLWPIPALTAEQASTILEKLK